jgi:TMP repeat
MNRIFNSPSLEEITEDNRDIYDTDINGDESLETIYKDFMLSEDCYDAADDLTNIEIIRSDSSEPLTEILATIATERIVERLSLNKYKLSLEDDTETGVETDDPDIDPATGQKKTGFFAVMGRIWRAIKNFFSNMWDGIKKLFSRTQDAPDKLKKLNAHDGEHLEKFMQTAGVTQTTENVKTVENNLRAAELKLTYFDYLNKEVDIKDISNIVANTAGVIEILPTYMKDLNATIKILSEKITASVNLTKMAIDNAERNVHGRVEHSPLKEFVAEHKDSVFILDNFIANMKTSHDNSKINTYCSTSGKNLTNIDHGTFRLIDCFTNGAFVIFFKPLKEYDSKLFNVYDCDYSRIIPNNAKCTFNKSMAINKNLEILRSANSEAEKAYSIYFRISEDLNNQLKASDILKKQIDVTLDEFQKMIANPNVQGNWMHEALKEMRFLTHYLSKHLITVNHIFKMSGITFRECQDFIHEIYECHKRAATAPEGREQVTT